MLKDFIKIDLMRKIVAVGFRVVEFKNNDFIIAYIPSVNLSAYGKTIEEVQEMLNEVVRDYIDNLMELPEYKITEELNSYGWIRHPFFKKKFENKTYIDQKGILRNFNLPEDTKTQIDQVQMTL